MDGISAASAILGVAQIGLQFSQVLITVIGDYRDAAKNINRLRDEIQLTSICLKQLGDLGQANRLGSYAILEATHLRERCQTTFWEIRLAIKTKASLDATDIRKDQIDVTWFEGLKWALYTKNKLAGPREELDRLKDSLTLCFVSQMAASATDEMERVRYSSQIPGIKKSLAWSDTGAAEDVIERRLRDAGISDEKIAIILGRKIEQDVEKPQVVRPNIEAPQSMNPGPSELKESILKAWSIDQLGRVNEIPVSEKWIEQYLKSNHQGDGDILKIYSKLHPWFQGTLSSLPFNEEYTWSIVHLRPVYKHLFHRGLPESLQFVMKGLPQSMTPVDTLPAEQVNDSSPFPQAITYSAVEPLEQMVIDPNDNLLIDARSSKVSIIKETDEDIIAKQLALYK